MAGKKVVGHILKLTILIILECSPGCPAFTRTRTCLGVPELVNPSSHLHPQCMVSEINMTTFGFRCATLKMAKSALVSHTIRWYWQGNNAALVTDSSLSRMYRARVPTPMSYQNSQLREKEPPKPASRPESQCHRLSVFLCDACVVGGSQSLP